jgi:CRISPR/Cas system CMR-associated protein Cmr3 (group 5 of RAMP superfamily)
VLGGTMRRNKLAAFTALLFFTTSGFTQNEFIKNAIIPAPIEPLSAALTAVAHQKGISNQDLSMNYDIGWTYLLAYEDDQQMEFIFEGPNEVCRINVGSLSLSTSEVTCY